MIGSGLVNGIRVELVYTVWGQEQRTPALLEFVVGEHGPLVPDTMDACPSSPYRDNLECHWR